MPVRPTGLSGSICLCVPLHTWIPTLLQRMASLAFVLALLVTLLSVLGFDIQSNDNVRLSTAMLIIVDRHSLRQLGRCVSVRTNSCSYRLVDRRWPEQCRYWGQDSFGATQTGDKADWQKTLAFYCQVKT